MAEINIEKKKKPVWPWILLLVLLALIGWVIYDYMSDGEIATSEPAPTTIELVAQQQAPFTASV